MRDSKYGIWFMDKTVFDNKLKEHNLGVLLAVAEKDVKDGRTKDARIFLKKIKESAKISSWDHATVQSDI